MLKSLLARVKQIAVGDPDKADTLIGPIINAAQVKKHQQIIQIALEQGAELIYDGGIQGNLVAAHVFINVDPSADLAQEESFGPILPILQAENEAHALELANSTRFGLSGAVCTRSLERGAGYLPSWMPA